MRQSIIKFIYELGTIFQFYTWLPWVVLGAKSIPADKISKVVVCCWQFMMSSTSHYFSWFTSMRSGSGSCCSIMKSSLYLCSTEIWNTRWPVLMKRGGFIFYTDVYIRWLIGRNPVTYAPVCYLVVLLRCSYCSAILACPYSIVAWCLNLCQIACTLSLLPLKDLWWAWIGILQSVWFAPQQLGYIVQMME